MARRATRRGALRGRPPSDQRPAPLRTLARFAPALLHSVIARDVAIGWAASR